MLAHLNPKYKLEEGTTRVKHSSLQRCVRADKYKYVDFNWVLINDLRHNDFKGVVDIILNSGKSFNIDGRAGSGK